MKRFGGSKAVKVLTLLALIICLLTIVLAGYAYTTGKGLESSLLRLHVIANSDSKEDQELKLRVRDKVVDYIKTKYGEVKDKEKLMSLISQDLDGINLFIKEYISSENKSCEVKTELSKVSFPTRDYGMFKIPAGIYDALRIVIGKGEGKNWWCVLFPPLCFVDAGGRSSEDIANSDEAQKLLKKNLTEEEYSVISESKENKNKIKFKFKIVEVFQDSKVKLSMVKNNIRY